MSESDKPTNKTSDVALTPRQQHEAALQSGSLAVSRNVNAATALPGIGETDERITIYFLQGNGAHISGRVLPADEQMNFELKSYRAELETDPMLHKGPDGELSVAESISRQYQAKMNRLQDPAFAMDMTTTVATGLPQSMMALGCQCVEEIIKEKLVASGVAPSSPDMAFQTSGVLQALDKARRPFLNTFMLSKAGEGSAAPFQNDLDTNETFMPPSRSTSVEYMRRKFMATAA